MIQQRQPAQISSKPKWIYLLLYLIPLGTICGNVFVCLAVCLERRLRNRFNIFLVSLAVSDMLCALLVMPMSAYKMIFDKDSNEMPREVCLIWYSLDIFFTATTIIHLCTISLDRYLALRKPLVHGHPNNDVMGYSLYGKIAIPWLTSFFIAGPLFLMALKYDGKATIQEQNSTSYKGCGPNDMAFVLTAIAVTFVLPLFIMISTYLLTIRTLKYQMNQAKQARLYATSLISDQGNSPNRTNKGSCMGIARKTSEGNDLRRFSFRPSVILRSKRFSSTKINNNEVVIQKRNNSAPEEASGENEHNTKNKILQNMCEQGEVKKPMIVLTDCSENGIENKEINKLSEEVQNPQPKSKLTFHAVATQVCLKNRAKSERSFELWRRVKEYKEFLEKEDRKLELEWGSIDDDEQSSSPNRSYSTNLRKVSDRSIESKDMIMPQLSENRKSSTNSANMKNKLQTSKRGRSNHKNTIDRIHKGTRAMQVIGVLFGVFVACYLPFFLLYIIEQICEKCRKWTSDWIPRIEWLGYIGSMLNPFVYHFFNPAFRRTFRKLMHCEYIFNRRKANSDYRAVWRARV